MKCISSPALDDTQIVAFIEGEADNAVVAHIKECVFCREKANQWSRLQNRLQRQLYRVTCPSSMELGDYHLGLLPASRALAVAQHVRNCPLCRQEVAKLEGFLTELATGDDLLGTAKVIIARIISGTTGESVPSFGTLRGEEKGPLTFEADGVVITLDFQTERNGQVSILGQLAAEVQDQWTGAEVELQQADSAQQTASVDDLGAFRFVEIRPGAVHITIKALSGIQIEIPNIDIPV